MKTFKGRATYEFDIDDIEVEAEDEDEAHGLIEQKAAELFEEQVHAGHIPWFTAHDVEEDS